MTLVSYTCISVQDLEQDSRVEELQQQLQSSERERQTVSQQLTRAEETIRREQQQIRQQVCGIGMCGMTLSYLTVTLNSSAASCLNKSRARNRTPLTVYRQDIISAVCVVTGDPL